jgi:hypothetical protein
LELVGLVCLKLGKVPQLAPQNQLKHQRERERERESCLNPSYKITQKLLYTVVCNTVESERERERESLTNYESNKVDGKDLE